MSETQRTQWDLALEALEGLPEEGPISREEVETWAWWMCRLVNVFEERGWTYRGASIRYDGWSTLMVVKGRHEGTPYVVFVTERDTTRCMAAFRRALEEGRLQWREDKFG